MNTAYFEWKYQRNPYLKEPLIYLAMHNGKVVGMRGFFGVRWEAGVPAQKFTSLYADDAVIAPEHRNCGLMPRIMATAFADLVNSSYDYVFNLSAGALTLLSSLSMGWRSAGYIQPMHWRTWRTAVPGGLHRVLKRSPLMSRKIDALFSRWSTRRSGTLAAIDEGQIRRVSKAVPGISFQDVPRCADMAELVERIGRSGRIRHVRNREYFDWRFQNPLSRYRFLYRDTHRLEGYLVLQEYTSEFAKPEIANIVDWEASSVALQAELLRAALKLLRSRRVVIWSATLTRETTELLVRNGFKLDKPSPGMLQPCPGILARAIREQKESDWLLGGLRVTDLANWDIRMLFSMQG